MDNAETAPHMLYKGNNEATSLVLISPEYVEGRFWAAHLWWLKSRGP